MKNKFKIGQKVRFLFLEQARSEDWRKGIVREIRQGFWGRKYLVSRDDHRSYDWIWHVVKEKDIRQDKLPGVG